MDSSEPRVRTSGQVPSWTPATTTRSHSSPLARWAVRTATPSPREARSASVSPTISCPAMLSRKSLGEPCGSRAVNRAAASNKATTASRSASAAAPRLPPAALACCHEAARLDAFQTAQSTSCAVPPPASLPVPPHPRFSAVSAASASSAATRCAAATAIPPASPVAAARGFPMAEPIRSSSRGSRSAAASGSSAGSSPAAWAEARSQRRSRRRPSASVPPSGPVSSSAAVSSSSAPGRSAQSSKVSSGRVPGSEVSGSSSPAIVTGTPAAARERRSSGTWRVAERTRTAIDDHATPSIRCARRRVSAMTEASWLAVAATMIRAVPGSALGSGMRTRWARSVFGFSSACAAGRRAAIRRDAVSRNWPLRRQVRSAITFAGLPSGARNRSVNRLTARVSAPRNP